MAAVDKLAAEALRAEEQARRHSAEEPNNNDNNLGSNNNKTDAAADAADQTSSAAKRSLAGSGQAAQPVEELGGRSLDCNRSSRKSLRSSSAAAAAVGEDKKMAAAGGDGGADADADVDAEPAACHKRRETRDGGQAGQAAPALANSCCAPSAEKKAQQESEQPRREDLASTVQVGASQQETSDSISILVVANSQQSGQLAQAKANEDETNRLLAVGSRAPQENSSNSKTQQDTTTTTTTCLQKQATTVPLSKQRRLSYLQSLLLRRWPCLALTICIMSSLTFAVLLSALTVYLMHDLADCGGLALAAHANGRLANGAATSADAAPAELGPGGASMAALDAELSGRRFGASAALLDESSAAAVAAAPALSAAGEKQAAATFQRLPASVWPEHYDLFFWPIIAEPAFNFTGKVSIRIKCLEPTRNITLHTVELDIDEKSLRLELLAAGDEAEPANRTAAAGRRRRDGQPSGGRGDAPTAAAPKVSRLSQDKQLHHSIVELDAPLGAGSVYVLTMHFVGLLNDDLAGFYKIRYERQNSTEPTWIAATQFQATDARRAFPCFDEPLYKATFSIQIKHLKNMTALSNMPIIRSEQSGDGVWITDTFAKSHKMSTYLVAFAVTNFESRSEGNISVWTRPGFAHTAEYSLKIAGKILRYYEKFFGIEYPLPKMDMIALPDFNAGAMENWGLITYRETAMLYDEKKSSIVNKQRVATVVAHELAHQWFGNLVTPKWWDDLWLNEGFASYVEYIGVDHVEPKWRMLDQFLVEEVQNVFKFDALSSSHQISIPVTNPDEISEIFDHISYSKGASIIRMMNYFLTEDVFKAGLQRYLRALKYSNAEQSDLWTHLTAAQRLIQQQTSGNKTAQAGELVDVGRVMNSWTLQTGYPLVTLTRSYGQGAQAAKLEQVRFEPLKFMAAADSKANGNESAALVQASAGGQRWEIPITYTWKSEQRWAPNTRLWLHQNDSGPYEISDKSILPSSDDDWMILNVNQVGYYRVNYDERNWRLLVDQLNKNHSKISTTNRAQLLDDIFELAKCSVLDYKFAMEATRYLRSERDYISWDAVGMSFAYIDDMLQRTPIYGDWRDYMANLIEPYYGRYKHLDWTTSGGPSAPQAGQKVEANKTGQVLLDQDDVLEQYNQVNAISWACQVDEHCISRAKSVFREWKSSQKNRILPSLRYTIYCTAIENGSKEDWDFLWQAYEREQNASERDRMLRALGCSKELWILSRYLEWIFNKTKPIRRQDGAYVFRMIAKNNYGRDVAFNFMRERWQSIRDFYGKSSFSFGLLIRSVSTSMNTQIELQQLKNFYESVKADVGSGKRAFQIAIEEVEGNVAWRKRNYNALEEWLHKERSRKASGKLLS